MIISIWLDNENPTDKLNPDFKVKTKTMSLDLTGVLEFDQGHNIGFDYDEGMLFRDGSSGLKVAIDRIVISDE